MQSRFKEEYDQLESDVSLEVSESEQEQEKEEDVNTSLLSKRKSQQKSESISKATKKQQKMKRSAIRFLHYHELVSSPPDTQVSSSGHSCPPQSSSSLGTC